MFLDNVAIKHVPKKTISLRLRTLVYSPTLFPYISFNFHERILVVWYFLQVQEVKMCALKMVDFTENPEDTKTVLGLLMNAHVIFYALMGKNLNSAVPEV